MSIDQTINEIFEPISKLALDVVFYSVPITSEIDLKLILVLLLSVAVFLTIYLGFINIRFFAHALKLTFKAEDKNDNDAQQGEAGQISRFQALMTSLSGSVGLGNISGVAIAISVGGAGAMFWMIVCAIFGMSTKFSEVMLGLNTENI